MKNKFRMGLAILASSGVACQPVFAIGWREMVFIFILTVIVFGPPVYRFLRRLENYRKQKGK